MIKKTTNYNSIIWKEFGSWTYLMTGMELIVILIIQLLISYWSDWQILSAFKVFKQKSTLQIQGRPLDKIYLCRIQFN